MERAFGASSGRSRVFGRFGGLAPVQSGLDEWSVWGWPLVGLGGWGLGPTLTQTKDPQPLPAELTAAWQKVGSQA